MEKEFARIVKNKAAFGFRNRRTIPKISIWENVNSVAGTFCKSGRNAENPELERNGNMAKDMLNYFRRGNAVICVLYIKRGIEKIGKGKLLFLLKREGNIFLKFLTLFGYSSKPLLGEYFWDSHYIYIYLPAHSDVIRDIPKTIHHEFLHKTIHSALGKRYEILNQDFEEKLIDKLSGFKY